MPAANQRPENELRAEAYLSRVSALQSELTCQLQHLRALRAHGRAASGAQDVLTPCACGRSSGAWSNCAQTFPARSGR